MPRWLIILSLLTISCQREGHNAPTIPSRLLDDATTSPSASSVAPREANKPPTSRSLPELSPKAACARLQALREQGCEWVQRFPPEFTQGNNCENSVASWLDPAQNKNATGFQKGISCWALDCEAAMRCTAENMGSKSARPPRKCGEEGTSPVMVDASTWATRQGATIKRFADANTSVHKPIEVCNIQGELEWVTRVTCNDGSNPYKTLETANNSRDSWFAQGGRCNSVLDRFSVPCPEKTYVIHIDRYICPNQP